MSRTIHLTGLTTLQFCFILFCCLFSLIYQQEDADIPQIENIVVVNWEKLIFRLNVSKNPELLLMGQNWTVRFSCSSSKNDINNFKPCNVSKNGTWSVSYPYEKANSDGIIILAIIKTNQSRTQILSYYSVLLDDYVKPGPPRNISHQEVKDRIMLTFSAPQKLKSFIYNVSIDCDDGYHSNFRINAKDSYSTFFSRPPTDIHDSKITKELTTLPFFTTCHLKVTCVQSNMKGFWSNPAFYTIRSLQAVPIAAPEMCTYGGFTILSVDEKYMDVVLHFKELAKEKARGRLMKFRGHLFGLSKMLRVEIQLPLFGLRRKGDKGKKEEAMNEYIFSGSESSGLNSRKGTDEKDFHVWNPGDSDASASPRYENDGDREDDHSVVEVANNNDFDKFEQQEIGNFSHLSSHDAVSGIVKAREFSFEFRDPILDISNTLLLRKVDSRIGWLVAVDAQTKMGYNSTLELNFVSLPSYKDIETLPVVGDVGVIYSGNVLYVLWKVMYSVEAKEDVIYSIFYCPVMNFSRDGRGCLTNIDWFQIQTGRQFSPLKALPPLPEMSSAESSAVKQTFQFKQEIRFPLGSNSEAIQSFVFGVSATTSRNQSKGIIWSGCSSNSQEVPHYPKMKVENVTSTTAIIKFEKFQCRSGAGYLFAYNISYCPVERKEDDACLGVSKYHLLGTHDTSLALQNLVAGQSYKVTVNGANLKEPSLFAADVQPRTMANSQLNFSRKSSYTPSSISPLNILSATLDFSTISISPPPATQIIVVHPAMMAFLSIIGLLILCLIIFGFIIIWRLYRKSMEGLRINLPDQFHDNVRNEPDVLIVDDYNTPSVVDEATIQQSVLPPVCAKKKSYDSDSGLRNFKMERVSLLSVASDSFKSCSELVGNQDFPCSIFSTCNNFVSWSKKSSDVKISSNRSSSSSSVSLNKFVSVATSRCPASVVLTTLASISDKIPAVLHAGEPTTVPDDQRNNGLRGNDKPHKNLMKTSMTVFPNLRNNSQPVIQMGQQTERVKEDREWLEDSVEKEDKTKLSIIRVLPPIASDSCVGGAVAPVVQCFPIHSEPDSSNSTSKKSFESCESISKMTNECENVLSLKKEATKFKCRPVSTSDFPSQPVSTLSSIVQSSPSSSSTNSVPLSATPSTRVTPPPSSLSSSILFLHLQGQPPSSSPSPVSCQGSSKSDSSYDVPKVRDVRSSDESSPGLSITFMPSSSVLQTSRLSDPLLFPIVSTSPSSVIYPSSLSLSPITKVVSDLITTATPAVSSSPSSVSIALQSLPSSSSFIFTSSTHDRSITSLSALPQLSGANTSLPISSSLSSPVSFDAQSSVLPESTNLSSALNPSRDNVKALPAVIVERKAAVGDENDDDDDDDYTGCRETAILPVEINSSLLDMPALPVNMSACEGLWGNYENSEDDENFIS